MLEVGGAGFGGEGGGAAAVAVARAGGMVGGSEELLVGAIPAFVVGLGVPFDDIVRCGGCDGGLDLGLLGRRDGAVFILTVRYGLLHNGWVMCLYNAVCVLRACVIVWMLLDHAVCARIYRL